MFSKRLASTVIGLAVILMPMTSVQAQNRPTHDGHGNLIIISNPRFSIVQQPDGSYIWRTDQNRAGKTNSIRDARKAARQARRADRQADKAEQQQANPDD